MPEGGHREGAAAQLSSMPEGKPWRMGEIEVRMSYANVEKFAEIILVDPAIAGRLAEAETQEQFIDEAIESAGACGLPFNQHDAKAWIATSASSN